MTQYFSGGTSQSRERQPSSPNGLVLVPTRHTEPVLPRAGRFELPVTPGQNLLAESYGGSLLNQKSI
jgi:hypothetical protein